MKLLTLMSLFAFITSCASGPKNKEVSKLVIKGKSYREKKEVNRPLDSNKSYVLTFLSPKCPCSNSHLAHLNQLKKKFPELEFIGIHSNTDETFTEGLEVFQSLSFNVIRDKKARLANVFGALKTPHVFVIHKGKQIYQGGVTERSNFDLAKKYHLEHILKQLKQGKELKHINKPTLGCAIARY